MSPRTRQGRARHELAHAVAAAAQGLQPVVYPGAVVTAVTGTTAQQVVTLAAGPLGSLLVGLAFLLVASVARGFWGLFLLWFGALGVQECTGYLMTGPFVRFGDVGSILQLVAAPAWAGVPVLVVGAAGMLVLGRHFTVRLLGMVDPVGDIAGQLRALGLYAWLVGALVSLGAYAVVGLVARSPFGLLSPVGLFEALAALTSGIFVLFVRLFMGGDVARRGITVGWVWPAAGVVLVVAITLGRALVLGPGLRL